MTMSSQRTDREHAKFRDASGTQSKVAVHIESTDVPVSAKANVALARNVYSSSNVTTAAYVELVASLSDDVTDIYIFDSSGQVLVLAVGAAASEVNQYYIVPGGNGLIQLGIASGSRVSIKAVTATAATGEFNATFLG